MATRNERRRRAKARAQQASRSHGSRMMLHLVSKSEESQQIKEDQHFLDLYDADKAVSPLLPLDGLWQLYEENAIHSGCINAKVADSVGRGWHLETEDEDEEAEGERPARKRWFRREKAQAQAEDQQAVARRLTDWLAQRCKDPNGNPMPWSSIASQWVREFDAMGWGVLEIGREGEEIALISPMPGHTLRATKDTDVYVQIRGHAKVYFKRFGAEGNVNPKTGLKSDDSDTVLVGNDPQQTVKVRKADLKPEQADEEIANEVLILKHYTPRTPYYGIPQWVSGIPTLAELVSIREYNVSWHESGGVGDKIVHTSASDVEEAQRLSESLREQFKQTKGRGHSTYFSHSSEDAEVTVHPLSKNEGNRDGQFKERRYDLNTELLIAHQVPGYRVGWAIMGTLGGNAAEEMIDSYRYGVVEPIQEQAEVLLNSTLFAAEAGGFPLVGYSFAFDDVDWSEMETELEKANSGLKAGTITPNEWREALGWERDEEDPALDLYWVMTQTGPMQLGAVAPEATDTADVLKEVVKALDVVIKGSDGPDALVAAPHTHDEAEDDSVVADGPDDGSGS